MSCAYTSMMAGSGDLSVYFATVLFRILIGRLNEFIVYCKRQQAHRPIERRS